MITLIIVNCQSDYITGTVSSKASKNIIPEIKEYIKENRESIDKILFAIEWHPHDHCSFKKYGGEFPSHCVQYTPGACIEPKLLKQVQNLGIPYSVSIRGEYEDLEDKGAFSEIEIVQDALGSRCYLDDIVVADADTDFIICGIGDAVYYTLKNLISNRIDTKVFMKGIYTADNKLIKYIKEREIEKV